MNNKKGKLIAALNKASKKRYKFKLVMREILNYSYLTPKLKKDLANSKRFYHIHDKSFNRAFKALISSGMSPSDIENKMWYYDQWEWI